MIDQLKQFVMNQPTPFTLEEAAEHLGIAKGEMNQPLALRIAISLKKLGCKSVTYRRPFEKNPVRMYIHPNLDIDPQLRRILGLSALAGEQTDEDQAEKTLPLRSPHQDRAPDGAGRFDDTAPGQSSQCRPQSLARWLRNLGLWIRSFPTPFGQ